MAGASLSPNGVLATSGADGTVRLWDLSSTRPPVHIEAHEGDALDVKFSPDGRLLASSGKDGFIRIWTPAGQPVRVLEGHTNWVTRVVFSPDSKTLASVSHDRSVRSWDVASGRLLRSVGVHDDVIGSVAFHPTKPWVVSVSNDRSARLWDLGVEQPRVSPGHRRAVPTIAASPDGRHVVSAGIDQTLRAWDLETGDQIYSVQAPVVWDLEFVASGRQFISGGRDGVVRTWDTKSGAERRALSVFPPPLDTFNLSHDGNTLVTAGAGQANLWQFDTRRHRRRLEGHESSIMSTAMNTAGTVVATGSSEGVIRLWDAATGKSRRGSRDHVDRIFDLAFGPGWLASASTDGAIRVRDVDGGASRLVGKVSGRVYAVAVHPDGKQLGTASSDNLGRLWPLDGGAARALRGHRSEVNTIVFTPDGRRAVTGGDDGTVRTWDTASGRPHWRAPMLLTSGAVPLLFSHRGWREVTSLGLGKHSAPAAAWKNSVEKQARIAVEVGPALCMLRHDGHAILVGADGKPLHEPIGGATAVAGSASGCAIIAEGNAIWVSPDGKRRLLAKGVSAVATTDQRIALARAEVVELLDTKGAQLASFAGNAGDAGATAVQPLPGDAVAVGYRDGSFAVLHNGAGGRSFAQGFARTPVGAPLRIVAGPANTIAVGYASGAFGLWSLAEGRLLAMTQLHGPIVHLIATSNQVVAASELGQAIVWDLSLLTDPYCEIVNAQWREVDTIWKDGRVARQPTPDDHPCRSKSP